LTHYVLPDLFNPLRQATIRMHTALESFDYAANGTVLVDFELLADIFQGVASQVARKKQTHGPRFVKHRPFRQV
jgi:hypothetical protein